MIILTEQLEAENLVEVEGKKKRHYIQGVFIQSNIKNRNNRIYPKPIVEREVDRYIREMVQTNRAVGELNHPKDNPEINYERACIKINELREDGDNWIGKALVTTGTPMGKIVAGLMDDGVQMGVSSRATGSVKTCVGSVNVVQPNFHLIAAADVVSDPSAPDAFVQNLMEGKEWIWENGMLIEKNLEEAVEVVNQESRAKRLNEEKLVKIFEAILAGLRIS